MMLLREVSVNGKLPRNLNFEQPPFPLEVHHHENTAREIQASLPWESCLSPFKSLSRQDMHYFHTCHVSIPSVPPHTKRCAGSCHAGTCFRNTWLCNSSPDNFLRYKICGAHLSENRACHRHHEQHSWSDSRGKWSRRARWAVLGARSLSLVHSLGQQWAIGTTDILKFLLLTS